jgi:phosphoesterase RecJ-like protein
MEMGIDYPKIVDETFYTKTFAQNRILGQALLNARLFLDGKVIVSVITKKEMEEFGVLPKHLDGIVNQLRVTKDVTVAAFLYENEDGSFKGSLRVNGDFNVAEIAVGFGGGGHVKAAGFSVDGPAEEAVARLLKALEEKL